MKALPIRTRVAKVAPVRRAIMLLVVFFIGLIGLVVVLVGGDGGHT